MTAVSILFYLILLVFKPKVFWSKIDFTFKVERNQLFLFWDGDKANKGIDLIFNFKRLLAVYW
jgi:hypothetical protein